jgi:hypothetical protein
MGEIRSHSPVLLVMAAFSRHPAALEWAAATAVSQWGPIVLSSPRFVHHETRFYERTMGAGLRKTFFAFEHLIDPANLADLKIQANDWEAEYCQLVDVPETRPLNLDPGYLTEAKLVLASSKDRDHRIFLARGVFAEVTLTYQGGRWISHPWTYPDYQRPDYHEFFSECRGYLRRRYGRQR